MVEFPSMIVPYKTRLRLCFLIIFLLCSSLSAQILEDKFGNKYYYQKIEGEATSLRVLFVSDPHGNTYKTSHVIALKKELEKNHPEDEIFKKPK